MTRVSDGSRIALHELSMRLEHRDGDPEWVIGRADTGDFIAVPQVAADVIALLREGLTVSETHRQIHRDQGRDVDVADFVAGLVDLGFVRSVDGAPVDGTEPPPATLPGLRPRHARWLFRLPVLLAAAVVVTAAVIILILRPELLPAYPDLLWTGHTSAVLIGNAALAWSIIGLHELAHLITARAAGVGGRIGFGTRLQFLVAQTDVSGIWAAPRSRRIATYLAGMTVNVLVAAVAVLIRAAAGPHSTIGRMAAATVVLSLVALPPQLLLFMRTDLYFVLQDLTGCRNLYADGSAYVRHLAGTAWHAISRTPVAAADPLSGLPSRERGAVRGYAVLLAVGTMVCLAVAATVTVPFAVSVFARAATGLTGGRGTTGVADALVTAAITGTYWVLWGRAWWRRQGPRVRGWLHRHAPHHGTPRPAEGR
jgi:hypothetical protein